MLRLYWFLAFAIAWAITIPLALDTHHITAFGIPRPAQFLIGVAPAIAAFIAAAFERKLRDLWQRIIRVRAPLWTWLLALVIPALCLAVPFAVAYFTGAATPKLLIDSSVPIFAAAWLVLALGEEIGWRGYALVKLQERHRFWASATILGIIWCVWHYPTILGSPYLDFNQTEVVLKAVGLFSLQIVLANYIICWLFERSGRAVLVTTLFHTAFNTVSTVYFMAAMDMSVTGLMAVLALLIALFDRNPSSQARNA